MALFHCKAGLWLIEAINCDAGLLVGFIVNRSRKDKLFSAQNHLQSLFLSLQGFAKKVVCSFYVQDNPT